MAETQPGLVFRASLVFVLLGQRVAKSCPEYIDVLFKELHYLLSVAETWPILLSYFGSNTQGVVLSLFLGWSCRRGPFMFLMVEF